MKQFHVMTSKTTLKVSLIEAADRHDARNRVERGEGTVVGFRRRYATTLSTIVVELPSPDSVVKP